MKIETQDQKWKPIVVTIETREEAQQLYDLISESHVSRGPWWELYYMLGDRL